MIAVAITYDLEGRQLASLQMQKRKEAENLKEQAIEMVLGATLVLEGLPDRIFITERLRVRVIVESRRSRCFKCTEKDHVRLEIEIK